MVKSRILANCALMTALTALGSFFRIPVLPVACTLQTFFVFMTGMLLPPREALLAQGAYVLLGLLGLPIFSGGGGPGYLISPTFGYLPGFLLAAWGISHARKRFCPARRAAFLLSAAGAVVGMELLGALYMALMSLAAFTKNALPLSEVWRLFGIFLALDLIKLALCVPLCEHILKRFKGI